MSALRGDLDTAVTAFRGEMTVLRGDLDRAVTALRGEMGAMEARLSKQIKESASEIAQEVANVMVEQLRGQVSVVDEKYKDLPRQYAELRADFDSHVADLSLHRGPPATPAKRARRS
jgi:phage-related minor tail protein